MTQNEYKGLIDNRLECINRMLGTQMIADKTKQGYLLYEWKDNCPVSTSHITFTGGRLNPAEFLEYLDGVYNTLMALKYSGLTLKK